MTRSHPQLCLLHLLLLSTLSLYADGATPPPGNQPRGVQSEIDALTAFRLAVHDPAAALSTWDPFAASAPCSWRGIICSGGHVTKLLLPDLRLSGPISDRISDLPFLQKISLGSNSFSGPLPSSLSRLSRLTSLLLQFNSISGPIPSPLSNISTLQTFDVSSNLFTGPVPSSLPPDLRYLDLSSNSFTG